jgi:hypothetical protein
MVRWAVLLTGPRSRSSPSQYWQEHHETDSNCPLQAAALVVVVVVVVVVESVAVVVAVAAAVDLPSLWKKQLAQRSLTGPKVRAQTNCC